MNPHAPRPRRSVAGPLIAAAVAIAALVAVVLTVSRSCPAPTSPRPETTAEASPGVPDAPLAPLPALWCTYAEAFSCALTQDRCEAERGLIRMPSEPCASVYPWCFEFDTGKRTGKICAPSSDGCEQLRTGPLGAASHPKTGCIRESEDQIAATVTDPNTDIFGATPPQQWCAGAECTVAEEDCNRVRAQIKSREACVRRKLYCYGEAPMPFVDCGLSERECERHRRERIGDGRGDFGPCRLMP